MSKIDIHKEIKPKHKGTKKLFDNPIMEKLSRTHTAIPVSMFSLFSVFLIYWGLSHNLLSIWVLASVFVIGFFFFTFIEYIIHRYFYHMGVSTPKRANIQYTFHGVHHEYPKDRSRLAMPPAITVVLCAVLFGVFYVIMGKFVFAFLPGFLIGYSAYLFVHYAVHAFKPPKNFLKTLWIHHGIHHYKNQDKAYGVSSPFWDYVFRTMP